MARRTIDVAGPIDLRVVLGPHVRGPRDPTGRISTRSAVRATRTPDGPATLLVELRGDRAEAEAWGPGADRVLAGLPALLGLLDDPGGFDPSAHPVVADLARRRPDVRIGWTNAVFESLLPAILEQKVTGIGSQRRLPRDHREVRRAGSRRRSRPRSDFGSSRRPELARHSSLLRAPSTRGRAAPCRYAPARGGRGGPPRAA